MSCLSLAIELSDEARNRRRQQRGVLVKTLYLCAAVSHRLLRQSVAAAWVLTFVLLAPQGRAQTASSTLASLTVDRCRAMFDSALSAGGKSKLPQPPSFAATQNARHCADALVLDSVPPSQLVALAHLYRSLGDDRRAGAAIDRRLDSSMLTPPQRIEALRMALDIYGNTDTTSVRARALTRDFDALGSPAVVDRLVAHFLLARMADAYGSADTVVVEARQVLILAANPTLHGSVVSERTGAVAAAALLLANVYVSRHEEMHARALLDSMALLFPDLPRVPMMVHNTQKMYSLIGHTAPTLHADTWIGSDTTMGHGWRGKVYVLEFTAHWCRPCHMSYPALVDLQHRYDACTLGVVLETQTYGYFGKDTALAAAAEVERDRVLYAREVPAATAIALVEAPSGRSDSWTDPNKDAFSVKPLPVFVVIDATGIVLDIWFGWTAATRARLGDSVRSALEASGS